jgi:preprotein translocase subunit YajC
MASEESNWIENEMVELYNFCWLVLAQVPRGAGEAGDVAGQAPPRAPGFFEGWGFFLPAMLAFILVYLLLARPQNATAAKSSELLSKLKKNDRVITAGGILGTVVNYGTGDEFVTLRIDDNANTRMQVLATSIVRVVADKDAKTT